MAYFKPFIDSEGIHIPTYQDIMDYLLDNYKRIYGEDVYLAEDSPDYQLMSVFARCLDDYAALAVDDYNSKNIQYATGNALDLLLPLIAMRRNSATSSKAELELSGTAGTVIPAGSKVVDENGYLWVIQENVTLNENGDGDAEAICETEGAIRANIGTINRIYTAILGWNGVTNPDAAIPGKNTETDAEVRNRQKYVINSYSMASSEAVTGALMNLDGVIDVVMRINDTSTTDSETGIPGHSISCVVYGGEIEDIARTIYNKKAPGIGTHGDYTVSVADSYGVEHNIKFNRPEDVPVDFTVTIRELNNYDAELTEQVITETIENFVENNGIGQSMIIGQLIGLCYAAKPEIASSYVIQEISASVSGSEETEVLELDWTQRIVMGPNGVQFGGGPS